MTLDYKHFAHTLGSLADLLPFSKATSAQGLMLAWQSFPEQAKHELSNAHWTYAAGQYLLDPERPKETPTHLALLRYLYRLEWGQPNFGWGLKTDLHERMQSPGVFQAQPLPEAEIGSTSPLEPRHDPNGLLARLNGLVGDPRRLSGGSKGES